MKKLSSLRRANKTAEPQLKWRVVSKKAKILLGDAVSLNKQASHNPPVIVDRCERIVQFILIAIKRRGNL
jgi:hypothetical protein